MATLDVTGLLRSLSPCYDAPVVSLPLLPAAIAASLPCCPRCSAACCLETCYTLLDPCSLVYRSTPCLMMDIPSWVDAVILCSAGCPALLSHCLDALAALLRRSLPPGSDALCRPAPTPSVTCSDASIVLLRRPLSPCLDVLCRPASTLSVASPRLTKLSPGVRATLDDTGRRLYKKVAPG